MNKRFVSGAGRGKSRNGRKEVRFRPPMIGLLAAAVLAFSPMLTAQYAGPMEMMPLPMMSSLFPGLPMSREGSGTSWQPDSSPIYAWHLPAGKWTLMIHGGVFLRYTNQDAFRAGTRGASQLDAPNWIMIMAQPPRGEKGGFSFRGMFSFDRLTEGGGGYPLLFQTGETWKGMALVDRQHPHDLFSELSVSYGVSLGPNAGAFLYFGLPGEPALGPPAFMHRPSSLSIPDAPLGHHMQDSTHITFGVLTGGARYNGLKLDASVFTGREPDENRFNFDRPRFDSWSARLSFNPSARVALQVSHGFLHSIEAREPWVNVRRTTASLMLSRPLRAGEAWVTTFVWGMNTSSDLPPTHSFLADSEAALGRLSVYARIEFVQRQAHDLKLEKLGDRVLPVGALTVGTAWRLGTRLDFQLQAGAQASIYSVVDELEPAYGKGPFSLEVYLRMSPPRASMMGSMRH
ncbi:MAG: hypothetical protein ACYDH0_00955 [Candidatus Aminicenantales bacterium]